MTKCRESLTGSVNEFPRDMNHEKSMSFPVFWVVSFSGWGKLFCDRNIWKLCSKKKRKKKQRCIVYWLFFSLFLKWFVSILRFLLCVFMFFAFFLVYLFLCFISLQRALSEEASHIARTNSSFIVSSKSCCYCIISVLYHGYYFANVRNQAKCI